MGLGLFSGGGQGGQRSGVMGCGLEIGVGQDVPLEGDVGLDALDDGVPKGLIEVLERLGPVGGPRP